MKVCKVVSAGGSEQLVIESREAPQPGAGQVVITVAAAGVGFADVMMRSGGHPGIDAAGLVPGVEVAGFVSSTGAGVSTDIVGQRVYAFCGTGGYAEQVCVDAEAVVKLPEAVSFNAAVGTGVNAVVAHLSLERANVREGDAVLVRGAGGGIGTMAVQLAVAVGANCTAASSKPDQARSLGAHSVVGRDGGTGMYDIIIDPVAGADLSAYFSKLKANGRIVVCGAAGGLPPADFGMGLLGSFFTSPTLSAFSLNSLQPHTVKATINAIMSMAADGRLRPVLARQITLDEVAEAHRALEGGKAAGKFVISM